MSATFVLPAQREVLVVGAGPGGLAAATAAAHAGGKVTVLDENAAAGGQIWRESVAGGAQASGREKALRAFGDSGARLLAGRRVVDRAGANGLRFFHDATGTMETHRWDRLILATGARERLLPFPGWTRPGVFGAGGLDALVKGGFAVRGKRLVVAGTGPLLLAIAAHLRSRGATLVCVAEQAPLSALLPLAAGLWRQPQKLVEGAGYRAAMGRAAYRTGCWVVEALSSEGDALGAVTSVRLTDGRRTWIEACDLLATGFHLVPNTELATLLGCSLEGGFVAVDRDQQTTVPGIFAAGEPTGIAGLGSALVEGRIAGLSAAGGLAQALYARRDQQKAFGRALDRAFALRPELRTLATPDTIVCRCEDVRYAQLQAHSSWTAAKLQTRCGMGPCQGRVCGPALETLFGWRNLSVRPPLSPVPLGALLAEASSQVHEPAATTDALQETP